MEKRVGVRKLEKLSQTANEIGFRETYLKLEGLRTHLAEFRSMEEDGKEAKAKWLLRNIEICKPVIESEISDRQAPGFFYFRKDEKFKSGTKIGMAISAATFFAGYGMLYVCPTDSLDLGFAIIGASAATNVIGMIANTIKNQFSTFSGFFKDIWTALHDSEDAIRRYIDRKQVNGTTA